MFPYYNLKFNNWILKITTILVEDLEYYTSSTVGQSIV